jgi:hypothetical protein
MKRTITLLLLILSLTSCLTTKHEEIRSQSFTVNSITDTNNYGNQSALSLVALNDKDAEVRMLAVSKSDLQSTLSNVALNDKDKEVRKLAVSKLTLQSTLSIVALNDKDSEIRILALKLLK